MLFFQNDYAQGCIPAILEALQRVNDESNSGYGTDGYNRKAAEMLAGELKCPSYDIHFLVSGTLTNLTMIRHALRPFEGILCADTGHINVHEAGAVEATGHKIITVPNINGKVTVASIRPLIDEARRMGEHMVDPKALYISNATELGTVYSREEMEELSTFCRREGLYLIMDGARLANALTSGVDYTLEDVGRWCDMFSIGITKNGALFGESVVITNEHLKENFRYVMKQSGTLLPKGWLLGLQFIAMFENGDFYKNGKHANEMAMEIQQSAVEMGYPLYIRSSTNQVFPVVSAEQFHFLSEQAAFEVWSKRESSYVIRFVTSWHTSRKEVRELKRLLLEASRLEENH